MTSTNQMCCIADCKVKPATACLGCPNTLYCNTHYQIHREELRDQLKNLNDQCNSCHGELEKQTQNPKDHILMKAIDSWENSSINKIKSIAEEIRQDLLPCVVNFVPQVKTQLSSLMDEIRKGSQNDTFMDVDINKWMKELERLKNMLENPPVFGIQEESVPFINKIKFVDKINFNIPTNAQWRQNGATIAGGNGQGDSNNQLNNPDGILIDDNDTLFIADTKNNRVIKWKIGDKNGHIVAGGNGVGRRLDQVSLPKNMILDRVNNTIIIADECRIVQWSLSEDTKEGTILLNHIYCQGLAMDTQGYLYVSDNEHNEVRRYKIGESIGIRVAGGNGGGNRLNQLNFPTDIFVDQDYAVYISDSGNHRIMKWNQGATEGIVVAGGQLNGNKLEQLYLPCGIFVDSRGTIFIADSGNHRVVRWTKGATQGTVIVGGNLEGSQANQLAYPIGLVFDHQGNLYVGDVNNHRIQRFLIQ